MSPFNSPARKLRILDAPGAPKKVPVKTLLDPHEFLFTTPPRKRRIQIPDAPKRNHPGTHGNCWLMSLQD